MGARLLFCPDDLRPSAMAIALLRISYLIELNYDYYLHPRTGIVFSGGRVPRSGISDWSGQQKKQQNSGHLFRILFRGSKSQAGSSHNVYSKQSRHKASEAPSPMLRSMGRRTKSMTKQASRTGFNVIIIIRNLSWNFSVLEDF
jgi:hypothetical protein